MENNMLLPRGAADFDFYPYNPSKNAGAAFIALFGIMAAVHFILIFVHRAWFFVVFFLGCAAEAGGYYGRMAAHDNIRQSDPYLIQLFLLIIAVPLLSASIYMSYSRVVRALEAEQHSLVRVSWVSKLYIIVDIACMVLQVMGTVMAAYGNEGQRENSIYYISGGLIFQLVAFVVFMLLLSRIHIRVKREPTRVSESPKIHWKRIMWAIYIASALVLIRNAVRIVEFLQGANSTIAGNEAYLYALDAVPMILVTIALAAAHPGRLTRSARKLKTRDSRDAILLGSRDEELS